jgi:MFS family permease
MSNDQSAALPASARLWSRAAVVVTAAIFGLTYSLTAPLIALDLAERGIGDFTIGANAAMHAVGVLAMAAVLPKLASRYGIRPLILVALAVSAVVMALFPAMPAIWLWFPLRLLLGAASELLFVLSETWINHLSDERSRARAMAIYTAALSSGFALGPAILSVVGSEGATPYLVGAGSAVLAMLAIIPPQVRAPRFEKPAGIKATAYLRIAPIALTTTFLNAGVETAGLSFLTLYAMGFGWTEAEGTRLVSAMMIGAILLQLPIGWAGDKMDRRRLMLWLGVASVAGALIWPFVLDQPLIAYPLLFVWGGVFVGIYTMMLTLIGSRFEGADLVGVYAVMSLAWGAGALIGPSLAGLGMDFSPHGLPIVVALACLAYVLFLTRTRSEA